MAVPFSPLPGKYTLTKLESKDAFVGSKEDECPRGVTVHTCGISSLHAKWVLSPVPSQ